MLRVVRTLLLSGVAIAPACAAYAQTASLFPTPDAPLAYGFPDVVPNGGQPLTSVRNITGFDRVFAFGSSSSDTRNGPAVRAAGTATGLSGNTPAQFEELFSPLVGAENRRGSTFPGATNFAVGGTTSVTALPQVDQFRSAYGTYRPGDIVTQFSGINDFAFSNFGPITSRAVLDQVVNQNVSYQTAMVSQNLALGARNYVYVGLPDLGTFGVFAAPPTNVGGLQVGGNNPALVTEGVKQVNEQVYANLVTLHRQTGANIHYFDTDLLVREIRANPTAYGFDAARVQPLTSCTNILGPATACSRASFAEQNSYLSYDGIHYTYRFHTYLAAAIANQLIAPYTIAPQAEIVDLGARSFANSLLLRLNAYRGQNTLALVPATYTADLPGRAPPVVPTSVLLGNPVSLFAEGGFATGSRDTRFGSPGFDYDAASVTVGAEYRARPDLLLGAAFSYSNPSVNLTNLGAIGATRINVDSYQFAGFASLNRPDWFVDVVAGYGFNQLDIARAGIIDQIRSTPTGNTATVAAKAAYLFDFGALRIGPLGSLTYAHTWIDAYREQGDPLLTQAVRQQDTDALTGGAGIQVRLPFNSGGQIINPFVNVTAEHDFLGHLRTISTAQTYALALPTLTPIRGYEGGTYGKVAAGISFDLGSNLSATVNGSATFARTNGDDFAVNGGFRYRF